MTTLTMRTRLLASTMITGAAVAAVATGASAQAIANTAQATAAGTSVQELVVTGSRIPQKNLTSVSPVTTINNQTVKLQGTTNVEDLINNLPQAFADFGQFESNGSSGTATIDLRGLGNARTLVLIDGKRLEPGDPLLPVPDINMIPTALIDRVEVLTGGASAVYGSDAIAGVVNFIMKKNFQGLQIDGEFSIGEHNNNNQLVRHAAQTGTLIGFPVPSFPSGAAWAGTRWTTTVTGGANTPDDKGNVEFYLAYTHIAPVLESKYDWSTCGLATSTTTGTFQYCSGSSNDADGKVTPLSGPNNNKGFDPVLPPVDGKMAPFSNGQRYNFAPLNYIQRPDIRWQAGEFSHYEIAPWLDIYSNFMFMNDHSLAQVAPSGSFIGDRIFAIPCDDPLLSTAQADTLCGTDVRTGATNISFGRRNVEGGPRISDLEHYNYRFLIGAKGDIGQGWTYDVSAQFARVTLTDIEEGYLSYSKMINALNVQPNPAGDAGVQGVPTGAPVCAVAISGQDTGCVPWNIWSPGGVTPAALQYLTVAAEQGGETEQQVVEGNIAGELGQYGLKSPWASDGIGVSFGAAYARDFLKSFFDSVIQSGDLAGFGGSALPTVGSQAARSVYGEIRMPLIQNMPFFKDLTFEGGYRYSNYTHGGGNSTYKLGIDWQVVPDLRIRGSYERAVRAPNVSELFAPAVPGLVVGTDPCGGATPAFSAAECYNTVLHSAPNMSLATFTSTVYGNIPQCISGQCGTTTGGNTDLKPETAVTFSYGLVFTPTFFRGFSASVDYFNIKVDGGITVLPLNLIMTSCAKQDNPVSCALINRDPNDAFALFGGLGAGGVIQTNVNASSLRTSGIDVNADYRTSFSDWGLGDWGGLALSFTGTYVHDLVTSFPGESFNCAGLYGTTCGTPTPKWRHQMRLSWNTPWNLTLSLAWRYLSPTNLDLNSNQPPLQTGSIDHVATDAHIPAFSYFDLSFQYKFRNRYTVRGGVNNIFDRTPPIVDTNSFGISGPAFGNANTFPQVFDPLGRTLFVGLTADF